MKKANYEALYFHALRAAIEGEKVVIVSPTRVSANRVARELAWRMKPLREIIKQTEPKP